MASIREGSSCGGVRCMRYGHLAGRHVQPHLQGVRLRRRGHHFCARRGMSAGSPRLYVGFTTQGSPPRRVHHNSLTYLGQTGKMGAWAHAERVNVQLPSPGKRSHGQLLRWFDGSRSATTRLHPRREPRPALWRCCTRPPRSATHWLSTYRTASAAQRSSMVAAQPAAAPIWCAAASMALRGSADAKSA